MLDDLRDIETRVATRLAELRPLVEEYEELRRVAERLGVDVNQAAPKPASRRRAARARQSTRRKPAATRARARSAGAARTSSRSRPGGTQATGRERRERVLQLVRERPGITVTDISRELSVEPPPLYRVVRKLQEQGLIKKEGKQLELA